VIIGGAFTTYNGVSGHKAIARLNANGSIDTTFNHTAGFPVYSLARMQNGMTVVGGMFPNFDGQQRLRLVWLNPDPTASLASNCNPTVSGTVTSLLR